jgi:hypothetical protein
MSDAGVRADAVREPHPSFWSEEEKLQFSEGVRLHGPLVDGMSANEMYRLIAAMIPTRTALQVQGYARAQARKKAPMAVEPVYPDYYCPWAGPNYSLPDDARVAGTREVRVGRRWETQDLREHRISRSVPGIVAMHSMSAGIAAAEMPAEDASSAGTPAEALADRRLTFRHHGCTKVPLQEMAFNAEALEVYMQSDAYVNMAPEVLRNIQGAYERPAGEGPAGSIAFQTINRILTGKSTKEDELYYPPTARQVDIQLAVQQERYTDAAALKLQEHDEMSKAPARPIEFAQVPEATTVYGAGIDYNADYIIRGEIASVSGNFMGGENNLWARQDEKSNVQSKARNAVRTAVVTAVVREDPVLRHKNRVRMRISPEVQPVENIYLPCLSRLNTCH